jgi:hypothetical protein
VITGPDGLPLDVGRAQRTATTAIRRVVRDPGTARWHTFRPDGTASKLAVATGTARRPTHGPGPSRRPPPPGTLVARGSRQTRRAHRPQVPRTSDPVRDPPCRTSRG